MGLAYLLEEYFSPASVTCFSRFDALENTDAVFDYFFIDPDTFLINTDFFLRRRTRTAILSTANHISASACRLINVNALQEIIIEQLHETFAGETVSNNESKELSLREREVLRLIARGNTNKDIADALHISLHTVLSHRKNITSKLGVKTISGLTLYALMNGLL
jgi:DNA-binding CsgD family transcriptional regulator